MVTSPLHLPGVDPAWVRSYSVERHGRSETFSVLESSPVAPRGTIVCVHGNPTWSYMWRHLVRDLSAEWRVIALDQLGMGFSSRPPDARTLATRIEDLAALLVAAHVEGPVTLIAHDWGGPVALGWATQNPQRVEKLVLFNTGTEIPVSGVPGLIRVSNTQVLRKAICSQTKAFVVGAVLPTGGLARNVRRAYYSPYSSPSRRAAIADFVADIPTTDSHVTAPVLQDIAQRARTLAVPTLLLWGTRDFVFHTGVLADMQKTFPHAQTVTLDIGHLSPEHPDAPRLVHDWLLSNNETASGGAGLGAPDLGAAIIRRARETPADVAVFDAKEQTTTTWEQLQSLVAHARAQLQITGVVAGDRIAIVTPFSARTIAFIYACWAEGIVPVVADPGLGIANMRRALRESRPNYVLTVRATRYASRILHLAYRAKRLDLEKMTSSNGGGVRDESVVSESSIAAVLYTSGATGPAKGVVYTHGQLRALAQAIQLQFSITDNDGIAAAYIPFALYGPAWGVGVALPRINVVAPGRLTSQNLRDALDGVNGTVLFAAPAPLRNVIKDGAVFPSVRCVMSAGAPVSDSLLADVSTSFPSASLYSPYGMTEMLIVSDGVREKTSSPRGVPVGRPLPGVDVSIFPMGCVRGDNVQPVPDGQTGEIFVTGPWLSVGYDQHWMRNHDARIHYNGHEWHRTGDVGHVDGGLFVEGRVAHVINGETSVMTPVPVEQLVESVLLGVTAAAVGVTTGRHQSLVVVLCNGKTDGAANADVVEVVRGVVPDAVAVLYKKELPVDKRHNSKIDRTALATWATNILVKT